MPVYLVSGKLGGGKSLACVGRIRDALLEGRRVATNLDLYMEHLLPARHRKVDVVRLPDKPTVEDLELIGIGNEEMDERKNGLIVLDELGSWLNARTFNDKTRQPVIDWLIHSRKRGWDVYFICQNIMQIDKQVRESLVEYAVSCRRLDRLRIPLIGGLASFVTAGLWSGRMPRLHVAVVRYGAEQHAMVAERWVYRGADLYDAYDTRQIFTADYSHGPYSYLTPWHLKGRHELTWQERLRRWWAGKTPPRTKPAGPAARLQPLMRLEPDRRWHITRDLIERGIL